MYNEYVLVAILFPILGTREWIVTLDEIFTFTLLIQLLCCCGKEVQLFHTTCAETLQMATDLLSIALKT